MKGKILIIEDEVKYAYILDRFFTSDDYEVTIAFDGVTGLQKFKEINPDIICLDIMLPKMDGWEVEGDEVKWKWNIMNKIEYIIYYVFQGWSI